VSQICTKSRETKDQYPPDLVLCYYVYIIMLRTTVVLPPRLKDAAQQQARSAGISFGEFLRRAVAKAVADSATRRRGRRDSFLDDMAVFDGEVPNDLSRRHDSYLYGEP
jgi:hypothetical protein